MPRIIQPEQVEPVVRALLGSIDIGDGGTSEQRGVIAASSADTGGETTSTSTRSRR